MHDQTWFRTGRFGRRWKAKPACRMSGALQPSGYEKRGGGAKAGSHPQRPEGGRDGDVPRAQQAVQGRVNFSQL